MKNLTILLLLLTLSTLSATARILSVKATLSGANEVPAISTTGTGTLVGTFDDVSGVLNYTLTFSGLSGAVTASHFHNAPAGSNAGVLYNIAATSSPFTSSQTFTAPHLSNLLAGNIYVNLHTSANPGGEIRGQLMIGMEIFNNVAQNNFYGIGGYSFTQTAFPAIGQSNPYVQSGPSPQNDFIYAVSATGGLINSSGGISTTNLYAPITITFKGNNVRKFGCLVSAFDFSGSPDAANIDITATTNLGNTALLTANTTNPFVGFKVLNENEYITSIQAVMTGFAFARTVLKNIILGDDQPQNVSLNFDGIDDFVSIPNNVGNFNYNQAFTVSCWVKPALAQVSLGNTDNEILEKWDQTGAYPFVIRYFNHTAGATDVGKVRVARYDGSNNPAIISTATISDGKWHHIALTTTGGNMGTMNLYIDGVQQGSGVTDNTNASTTNSSALFVGQRGNGINRFKGEIDEVRIWTVAKTQTEIQNEMFCKNPNTTNLQAAYNFNNGVPNGNNALISQVQDAVGTNHGTLNNFTKTGDASNWVTGQVKYVKTNGSGTSGSSWATAISLQTALALNPCNDLFDIYVATGTYKPDASNTSTSFTLLSGMKIYGGFAGTEKNLNERNMALIHSTNQTTLSGDLAGNDTPFNFSSNRNDNSSTVVYINGGYVTFDGFTVRGGQTNGISKGFFGDIKISNCRIVDNNNTGLFLNTTNSVVSNCVVAGNNADGIYMSENSTNFQNCVVVNNGGNGIRQNQTTTTQSNFTNCTIASNGSHGIRNNVQIGGSVTNNIKNTIIKDNAVFGISNSGSGTSTYNITFSLVNGITSGTGNLDGNTVNPQFVSPLANTVISDAGNYHLRTNSLCIDAGNNTGIAPLDLDRNIRPQVGITLAGGGTADMGAYEGAELMKSITSGLWHNISTWNYNRIPNNTDKVIIDTNHTVTVSTTDNTSQANAVEFKNGAKILYQALGRLKLGL